jgi:outer membrane protein OmpA-like peptidoglycan-associated protein
MRQLLIILVCFGAIWHANAQSLTVEIHLRNELTAKPIDATLGWPDATKVRRAGLGFYMLTLAQNQTETLTITRDGYFDFELKLDYEAEKSDAYHEIKLKPGVPQLNITVLDGETNETLTSAIDLFTMDESSIVFSDEVEVAPYTIDLEYDEVHVLQVRCPGYFSYKDTINYKGVFDGRARDRKIKLVKLKEGNKISLNNIYFKPNESELTDFGKLMLVELTHVLAQEKNLVVEIGAHTDDVGTNEYNQSLSEKRALSVKKHLLEKGAIEKQLMAKGYGESTPLTANDTEAARSMNRRVEFKILKAN